jgi:AraC-like DNA-binding protein
MRFDSFIPCDALKPYIGRFVISEQEVAQTYKVLPDTSLVIGFQYKGSLSVVQNGLESSLSASGITGLQDQFKLFKNAANTGTVLIYFKEMGAAHFFKQPLNEIFAQSLSMDNFISASQLAEIEERLCEATTDGERIGVVEDFLKARLESLKPDLLVAGAVHLIRQLGGDVKIASLAKQLHTSPSPLEKRFRKLVGASPKKYASIIRIQAILKRYPQAKNLTELGYGAGYFDQAHFIKDFKTFTGQTPEQYFDAQRW